jgi:hypothetical protein
MDAAQLNSRAQQVLRETKLIVREYKQELAALANTRRKLEKHIRTMRVRLDFSGNPEKKPVMLNMDSIPRVGEFLVSGTHGTCEILKVLYTLEAAEHDVVLVLGKAE